MAAKLSERISLIPGICRKYCTVTPVLSERESFLGTYVMYIIISAYHIPKKSSIHFALSNIKVIEFIL